MATVLTGFVGEADDFYFFADFDDAAFDSAGDDGATAGDGEDVFDAHQEGFIDVADGGGDEGIYRVHEFPDGAAPFAFSFGAAAFQGFDGGADDHGGVVAGEFVFAEEFSEFEFYQFDEFFVFDQVGFVQKDDDGGDLDLPGEDDVFPGLGHGAVGGGDDQDGAVHLGRAGDHVFNVIGVARTVDVGVVPFFGLVLDVADLDG